MCLEIVTLDVVDQENAKGQGIVLLFMNFLLLWLHYLLVVLHVAVFFVCF